MRIGICYKSLLIIWLVLIITNPLSEDLFIFHSNTLLLLKNTCSNNLNYIQVNAFYAFELTIASEVTRLKLLLVYFRCKFLNELKIFLIKCKSNR